MDVSAQLKAALSDRYIIEREIGAGGMATVYLARDVKHNRKVALKVLRPELGAVLGTERFLSEISVTANLQHPHLLPLFDSGEADGLLFYVMPFIQGESLRDRLDREKQLPVEEAVRIAVAAASALDYAHRHNVVHRDLKPENILLHDGQPVVADFGIALAVTNAGGTRVTQTGLSLGTPQYMSPEQATGDRVIDARSDIYSLGAVLYEMLTGEPPHIGHTVQAIIARVLTDRPHSVRSQRPSVPEHVEAATLRALEKLPADRFATAGEFAETLTGARGIVRAPQNHTIATYEVVPTSALARRRAMRAVPWAIAGIAVAALAAMATLRPDRETRDQPLKFEITFTDSTQFVATNGVNIALSPDGSRLAFTGTSGGRHAIFVRRMDATEAALLRGTEDGMTPVFSPDSRWILFGQGGGLKKIPADGGPITTVVDSANPHSKAWGDGDVILYFWKTALWKVSATGGKPTPLAGQDTAGRLGAYVWPDVLPGGRAALITIYRSSVASSSLGLVSIPDGKVTDLEVTGVYPRYVNGGFVVFTRENGSVMAAPFSLRSQWITGEPETVLDNVILKAFGATELSVTRNGLVAYRSGSSAGGQQFLRVTPAGAASRIGGPSGEFMTPRVSPDGRRVAVRVGGPDTDIYTLDLPTQTFSRLTSGGWNVVPVWTADGKRIVYASSPRARLSTAILKWQAWDGSGAAETFLDTVSHAISFGPPGTYIAVRTPEQQDILIAPYNAPAQLTPLVVHPSIQRGIRISPDGKLIAYDSDESGQFEVYVRPIPGPGGRLQVSTAGGEEPVWSKDGTRLFYRTATNMIAATIARSPELSLVRRDTLFIDSYSRHGWDANYDLLPNGDFLMIGRQLGNASQIFAIANWDVQLRERFARR